VVLQKGPRLFVPNSGQWPTPEKARLVLNEVTVHVELDALVFSVRVPDSLRPSDATAAVANQWAIRQHFVGASPNVQWELDSSGLAWGVVNNKIERTVYGAGKRLQARHRELIDPERSVIHSVLQDGSVDIRAKDFCEGENVLPTCETCSGTMGLRHSAGLIRIVCAHADFENGPD
jgi:hypothetical protein